MTTIFDDDQFKRLKSMLLATASLESATKMWHCIGECIDNLNGTGNRVLARASLAFVIHHMCNRDTERPYSDSLDELLAMVPLSTHQDPSKLTIDEQKAVALARVADALKGFSRSDATKILSEYAECVPTLHLDIEPN